MEKIIEGWKSTDSKNINRALNILRAINHPLRKQIVTLLNEKPGLSVTGVYVKLRQEQSVISQHLAILRRAKVVNATRNWKYIHYSVNHEKLGLISDVSKRLAAWVGPKEN